MQTTSLLAHSPEFHMPNKTDDSKAELKEVEDNSVNGKSDLKIQQISSPAPKNQVEKNQAETATEKNVVNSFDFTPTTNLLPQPGEMVLFMLLTTPFLLFSLKRYIFR